MKNPLYFAHLASDSAVSSKWLSEHGSESDKKKYNFPLYDLNSAICLQLNANQIEVGAKKLAEIFDYPWEYMPEEGKNHMRQHIQQLLNCILLNK